MEGIKTTMGVYDSANGKSLEAYNIVDATHICRLDGIEQVVIKYAKIVGGILAQINNLYQKNIDLGVSIHWNIDLYSFDEFAKNSEFSRFCEMHLGASPLLLSQFIFNNK